jgi:adrenodoxin-NADP+ reductase
MTTFDKVAEDDRFHFLGNVQVGDTGVSVSDLKANYNAVLFSYGASEDRKMNIAGEDSYGVESARTFVGWYNGHPDYKHLSLPLDSTDTAVVIGQGNVALDIARLLLSPIDELRKTDITEYALEALSKSRVKHVHVVGRRGPVQVSFTSKELREQMSLPGVRFDSDLEFIKHEIAQYQPFVSKNRPLKRLMGLLEKGSPKNEHGDKSWRAEFLKSPVEVLADQTKRVTGIKYEINTLEGPMDQKKAIGTGQFEAENCGLVFTSIGYKSKPLPGLPFDERQGRVPNSFGKVLDGDKELPGMYTAGWLKRGPTGVIVSTMADAYETADTILDDLKNDRDMLPDNGEEKKGAEGLTARMDPVTYQDWKKIEAAEFAIGDKLGKPREKFSNISDMLAVLGR